jgi:serine/threonine-protein kinase
MVDDARILELAEEVLDSGSTPETVCAQCPELLAEVKDRLKWYRGIDGVVEQLFPSTSTAKGHLVSPEIEAGRLPTIPGYEVLDILGRGGIGIVYRVSHLKLHRQVALKMLISGAYATAAELSRFMREAEAIAALQHPNIVQIYDVGEADGRAYFTMELVGGGSLAQRHAGAPQPAAYCACITETLARAIRAAHLAGIVHRDLKPGNILLTLEGTPKISDFGLARHFEGQPEVTQGEAKIGTPSYMAPEQVIGKPGAVGPPADVYALGATLYELLTGRPPFRAETATETQRQVLTQEPLAPSRLNPKVPRDLETICLKCLAKEPARRYGSAAELADDLGRFREGRPIRARRISPAARLWRWCGRKPAAAALVVTAVAFVAVAIGGGFWMERQHAQRREAQARQQGRETQAVEGALEKASILEQQGRWPEAQTVLEGAQRLLTDSAAPALAARVNQAHANAEMVARLEEIRLQLSEGTRGARELARTAPGKWYVDAFANYGIPVTTLEPAEAAKRIRQSDIRQTLLAFMHDWLYRVSEDDRARVRNVLDQADDDGWRHAFREALVVKDARRLSDLARAPGASAQPPEVVAGLAAAMLDTMYKLEAQEFMREAQQRYPDDFWVNYFLGCFWMEDCPQEAVGYFRVAAAIRPTSTGAYLMLGRALRRAGDNQGAIAAFRRCFALGPVIDSAVELQSALSPGADLEEARAVWEKSLERDPPDPDLWYGYPQFCLFVGNKEAYGRARKAILARFGNTTDNWIVAERTALGCLLLPDPGDELQRAIGLADLAWAAGERSTAPGNEYLQFVKGLALYRQGRPNEALPFLQRAVEKINDRAGPRLVLAMAQFQSGATADARQTLADVVAEFDWDEPRVASHPDQPTAWVSHVLRREAEALILPNLPKFVAGGDHQPADNQERIALLGVCQSRALYGAAARLYADAFAADPGLPDRMSDQCLDRAIREYGSPLDPVDQFNAASRYLAARCSALAASGAGKDGQRLSEPQRARLRRQACEWLQDDLSMWTAKIAGDSPLERNVARRMLAHWQSDPDLAGLRDAQLLDDYSAQERNDCLALWRDVRAVLKRAGQERAIAGLASEPVHSQPPSPSILMRLGRLKDARVAWKAALEADPPDHDAWYGYAELCLFLGDEEEYRRARRDLLERFGATNSPYVAERAGRACLLGPASGEELRRSVALAERAVATNDGERWANSYFAFVRGFAEYRQGHFDPAIEAMQVDASSVLGPAPAIVLAMALHQKGQADKARRTLASAILSYDWRANQVHDIHGCILHALRREAEGLILPNLPAFLEGKCEPRDNDERLALLGACQFADRTRAMARLYADAFAVDPSLAEDLRAAHRYNAARAAALAGCGQGADAAAGLDEQDRARWRRQAIVWLRADLIARSRALDAAHSAADRGAVRLVLTRWELEPDLAGLRDAGKLDQLPEDERKDRLSLWRELAGVLQRGGDVGR